MVLFFTNAHGRQSEQPPEPAKHNITPVDHITPEEFEYYNTEASEYMSSLPQDKSVIALLINDSCHHIFYYEKSNAPSFYVYDLESLTTAVVFGGESGLYCDTKLLMVGAILDWRRVEDNIVFIARNRAPEADYGNGILLFSVGMFDHVRTFIDYASEAYFSDDTHIEAKYANLLYQDCSSRKGVFSEYSVTIDLEKLL